MPARTRRYRVASRRQAGEQKTASRRLPRSGSPQTAHFTVDVSRFIQSGLHPNDLNRPALDLAICAEILRPRPEIARSQPNFGTGHASPSVYPSATDIAGRSPQTLRSSSDFSATHKRVVATSSRGSTAMSAFLRRDVVADAVLRRPPPSACDLSDLEAERHPPQLFVAAFAGGFDLHLEVVAGSRRA